MGHDTARRAIVRTVLAFAGVGLAFVAFGPARPPDEGVSMGAVMLTASTGLVMILRNGQSFAALVLLERHSAAAV